MTAKRAPEAPRGLEWVVMGSSDGPAAGRAMGTHPAGPVSPTPGGPSLVPIPLGMPPPGQYRRDFSQFTVKLVKTAECHQKVSKRPPVVPISKTRSKSQLL